MGIRFELAGSGITRAFVEINKAISLGGRQLQIFSKITGIAGDELKQRFEKDAVGVFRAFLKGLSGIEQTQIPQVLAELNMQGVEMLRVIPPMALGISEVERALDTANDEFERNEALLAESNAAFDTLNSKFILLKNSANNLATEIGATLAPIIETMVEGLTSFIQSLRDIDFGTLLNQLSSLALSLGLIFGTMKAIALINFAKAIDVSLWKSFLVTVQPLAVALWSYVKAALTAIIPTALLAVKITAIALAMDLVIRNIKNLPQLFKAAFDGLISMATKAFEFIVKGISKIAKYLPIWGKTASKELDGYATKLGKTTDIIFASVGKDTQDLDLGIFGTLTDLMAKLLTDAGLTDEQIKKIGDQLKKVKQENKKPLEGIGEDFAKRAEDALKALERLEQATKNLKDQNDEFGLSQRELIDIRLQRSLDEIQALENELKATGQLKGAIQALADARAEAYRAAQLQRSELPTTFGDVGGTITRTINLVFNTQNIESVFAGLKSFAIDIFENPMSTLKSMGTNLVSMMSNIGSSISSAFSGSTVSGFIDAIINMPDTINQIATMANNFAEWPNQMVEALGNLFDTLFTKFQNEFPKAFERFVKVFPELIKGIIANLPNLIFTIVDTITDSLPEIVDGLAEIIVLFVSKFIPDLLTGIFERLPEIVERLAEAIPIIALAFVEGIIELFANGGAGRIISSFLKAIPRIVIALVKGFVNGVLKGLKNLFSGRAIKIQSLDNLGDNLKKGLEQAGEQAAKVSNKLFAALSLKDETRALDMVDRFTSKIESTIAASGYGIWGAIKRAATEAWEFIKSIGIAIWQGLWNAITMAWELVKSIGAAIWHAFVEIATLAFEVLYKLGKWIWDGLVIVATEAWEWIKTIGAAIWDGLWGAITMAWELVKSIGGNIAFGFFAFLDGAKQAVMDIGGLIWDGLYKGLSGAFELFKKLGEAIWEGLSSVMDFGGGVVSGGGDLLSSAVDTVSGFFGLADGGLVTGAGMGDSVPRMLMPGEFVVKRQAVQNFGLGNLNAINQGQPVNGGGVNVTLNITNTGGNLDESFIRQRIIPAVKQSIKDESIQGRFVLASNGTRSL